MKQVSDWTVPKWPFLLGNGLLLVVAWVVIDRAAHPITDVQILLATGSVALGALLGALPFVLEYRAASKLVEMNALTTVAAQLQDLEKYAGQVAAATDQWARVQEATQGGAEKTTAAARDIAERMAVEIRSFNEFQAKLNDGEKNALRLEVEKLRRSEADWLQVLARILDHIHALFTAAVRSGQPEIAAQIGQFQNACRDAARRVGLVPLLAEPNEAFDPRSHRVHGVEDQPTEGIVAETLAPGYSFQGRLIRPTLVRLQTADAPAPAPAPVSAPAPVAAPAPAPTPAPVPAAPATPVKPAVAEAPAAAPAPKKTAPAPSPEAAPVAAQKAVEKPAVKAVEKTPAPVKDLFAEE